MRKKRIVSVILFIIVFIFFLLPPLKKPLLIDDFPATTLDFTSLPLLFIHLLHFVLGVFLLLLSDKLGVLSFPSINTSASRNKVFFPLLATLITFLSLFFIQSILQFIGVKFSSPPKTLLIRPQGVKYLVAILSLFLSSSFEEMLYRTYLPSTLFFIFTLPLRQPSKKVIKIIKVFCEVVAAVLFALSHKYLGSLAVINALIAHIILRVCYKKTNNLLTNSTAHFLYNLLCLLLEAR